MKIKYSVIKILLLWGLYYIFMVTGYWLILPIMIMIPDNMTFQKFKRTLLGDRLKDKEFLKELERISDDKYRCFRDQLKEDIIRKYKLGFYIFPIQIPPFISQDRNVFNLLCSDFDKLGYSIFIHAGICYVERKRG